MVRVDINLNPVKNSNLTRTVRRSDATNANPTQLHWGSVLRGKPTPRLVLSSDTPDFDPTLIDHWRDEGFIVGYLQFDGNPKAYRAQLMHLAESLELSDKWAICAFGEAATECLEACMKPMPKLIALLAYYPTHLPRSTAEYPPSLAVQIHLAGTQVNLKHSRAPNFAPLIYHYPDSSPGFAEYDLDEHDKVSSRISWSRSLGVLRRAFDFSIDLEAIWENHTALEFEERDADKTMATMVSEPYVNHIPTMTGGIGAKDLHRFYKDYFIPGNPPDTAIKLLSRTVGSDRVVDEMAFSFTHTQEVPWMLPGVPATGKKAKVALVSIVSIRGGKLYYEHIYWDQASVLVQIGLLDPKLVPDGFKTSEQGREKEVKRLPVVGKEAVAKVADEDVGESNLLIEDW
ncbi:putative dienelactone hydrolase [Phaeomoniella chlamydospora]|uniref:Putative dienelactone hydrolase n=1 Tax=Phaeomoniella chlamydospora TaxID=158046 RepID=A0A0G2EU83_PHACM|nr:putative dienelactone hydrolase [Phaeomoniella chlamydospora]